MTETELPVNQILQGDCADVLPTLPEKSIDLIFADPPYNLQLHQSLYRPNRSRVNGVNDDWDQFGSFEAYDAFCRRWLLACRRVLKDTGTLWVIGTYHNIYRIGAIMQDLGFWFLNDLVWIKQNPMPNFRGVRFTNAHETLIWASKARGAHYTFNHHAMKQLNRDLQMRSDWVLPICSGAERIKENGKKAHSTQKPEALLYRVILSSSNPGDVILDPFFGTGTTGAVARRMNRRWIGIEQEPRYIEIAYRRIEQVRPETEAERVVDTRDARRANPRVPFGRLLECGLLAAGQHLYFKSNREQAAVIRSDGKLDFGLTRGSIHKLASLLVQGTPCNGWELWFYQTPSGELRPIDDLRQQLRSSEKAD